MKGKRFSAPFPSKIRYNESGSEVDIMKKITAPRIPDGDLTVYPNDTYFIEDIGEVSEQIFRKTTLTGEIFEHFHLETIIFDGCVFDSVSLVSANLTDVVFKNCDLSNLDLMGAIIHRVRFENCKLIGVNFSDATLRNCVFVDCYADYVAFRYANLKWVAFEAGAYTNSDFSGAQLVDTYLERLDLNKAQFLNCALNGIDLSSCIFESITAMPQDLKGVSIDFSHAPALMPLFGIRVK